MPANLDILLLTETNFFGAIGEKGKGFVNIEFLERREEVQMMCEIENKMTIRSFILP